MSPPEIQAITLLIDILGKMSGWPFGVLFFMVFIGPWIMAIVLAYFYKRKYENNVQLVKDYQSIASDLKSIVLLNTQTITVLIEDIRTNQYCPYVRLQKTAIGRIDNGDKP